MARHLQEKYREYGRRKQQPFRFLVDQGKLYTNKSFDNGNAFLRFVPLKSDFQFLYQNIPQVKKN